MCNQCPWGNITGLFKVQFWWFLWRCGNYRSNIYYACIWCVEHLCTLVSVGVPILTDLSTYRWSLHCFHYSQSICYCGPFNIDSQFRNWNAFLFPMMRRKCHLTPFMKSFYYISHFVWVILLILQIHQGWYWASGVGKTGKAVSYRVDTRQWFHGEIEICKQSQTVMNLKMLHMHICRSCNISHLKLKKEIISTRPCTSIAEWYIVLSWKYSAIFSENKRTLEVGNRVRLPWRVWKSSWVFDVDWLKDPRSGTYTLSNSLRLICIDLRQNYFWGQKNEDLFKNRKISSLIHDYSQMLPEIPSMLIQEGLQWSDVLILEWHTAIIIKVWRRILQKAIIVGSYHRGIKIIMLSSMKYNVYHSMWRVSEKSMEET